MAQLPDEFKTPEQRALETNYPELVPPSQRGVTVIPPVSERMTTPSTPSSSYAGGSNIAPDRPSTPTASTPSQSSISQEQASNVRVVDTMSNIQRQSAIQQYGSYIPMQKGYTGETEIRDGQQMINISKVRNWEKLQAVKEYKEQLKQQEYFSEKATKERAAYKEAQKQEEKKIELYEKQVGTERYKGRDIPIMKLYAQEKGKERLATSEEREFFYPKTMSRIRDVELEASEKKVYIPYQKGKEKVIGTYKKLNVALQESYTEPVFKKIEKYAGVDVTSREFEKALSKAEYPTTHFGFIPQLKEGQVQFDVGVIPTQHKQVVKEFKAGMVVGLLKDVREQPLKQAILIGAGYGMGALTEGAVTGIGYLGTKASGLATGAYLAPEVAKLSKLGGVTRATITGVMGYGFVKKELPKIRQVRTASQLGRTVGVMGKDIALVGYGYGKGVKGFLKVKGYFETLKRTEIPIEKLVPEEVISGEKIFPTAPKNEQLQLFKESPYNIPIKRILRYGKGQELIYPDAYTKLPFKVPAGGYHATPSKFWKKQIIPDVGTSELEGLYLSYAASPYFTKVSGKSYKIFPSVKDIFTGAKKPAIAYIQPKGFRISKFVKTGEGYKWTTPVKEGYADIPLMKTEVEAVLRPESAAFDLISKDYYTTWKGVRVPIDIFKYARKVEGTKQLTPREIVSSYSYPEISSSIISPSTLYISSLKASQTSSRELSKAIRYSRPQTSVIKSSYVKPSSVIISSKPKSSISRVYSGKSASKYSKEISSSIKSQISKLSSKVSKVSYGSSYGRESYYRTPMIKQVIPYYRKRKPRTRIISKQAYVAQIKRRGRFIQISEELPKGMALRMLQGKLLRNIARTGRIVKAGSTEMEDISFRPSERIFRTYKIKGGKRIPQPDLFIQRTSANLQTFGEKEMLRQARIFKQLGIK